MNSRALPCKLCAFDAQAYQMTNFLLKLSW